MKNNSEKPLIIKIIEAEKNITKAINEAELPAFLLVKIIESYYNELQTLSAKEKDAAFKEYMQKAENK